MKVSADDILGRADKYYSILHRFNTKIHSTQVKALAQAMADILNEVISDLSRDIPRRIGGR